MFGVVLFVFLHLLASMNNFGIYILTFLSVVIVLSSWTTRILIISIVYAVRRWITQDAEAETVPQKFRRGISNDRFEDDKVPKDVDVVIVGSGMAGSLNLCFFYYDHNLYLYFYFFSAAFSCENTR